MCVRELRVWWLVQSNIICLVAKENIVRRPTNLRQKNTCIMFVFVYGIQSFNSDRKSCTQ